MSSLLLKFYLLIYYMLNDKYCCLYSRIYWLFFFVMPSIPLLKSLKCILLLSSHSVVSDSLRSCGLQHTRLPCPSPSPRACSNSCPLSQWCHPTILSSVMTFSCLQCFPESGSFPVSQLFESGGQSIGASALASVLPMNIQDWFHLGWTGWISLQSKGLSRVFSKKKKNKESSPAPQLKSINSSVLSFLYGPAITSIHDFWKNHIFVGKIMSLLFNMLSRLVIAFLPRSVF